MVWEWEWGSLLKRCLTSSGTKTPPLLQIPYSNALRGGKTPVQVATLPHPLCSLVNDFTFWVLIFTLNSKKKKKRTYMGLHQRNLASCSPWGRRVWHNFTTERWQSEKGWNRMKWRMQSSCTLLKTLYKCTLFINDSNTYSSHWLFSQAFIWNLLCTNSLCQMLEEGTGLKVSTCKIYSVFLAGLFSQKQNHSSVPGTLQSYILMKT